MIPINNMSKKLPNKFEIIRQYKAKEEILLKAIHLSCGICMGYFIDPYEPCTDDKCPLRQFYPTRGLTKSPKFKKSLMNLAISYDNPTNVLSEIGELEAKFDKEGDFKRTKDS